jgi:sulfite reductase alpha subunit-like flavoprotein
MSAAMPPAWPPMEQAAVTREAAEAYVENLKKTKRYQRDVY